MENLIFKISQDINDLLINNETNEARIELLKLLALHKSNGIEYNPLINHLIRETGLFPYIDKNSSNWKERFVFDAFKVDVGEKEKVTLHREQSLLLKELLNGTNVAVSAPTSFGKSFVIDAFIKIKQPKNVLLIVPTLALTDETRRRIHRKFSNNYKVITTSDVALGERNIFIFPQERALNYLDKVDYFDILIVDEFYKASSNFDKERSPSLIKAMVKIGKKSKQKYFLAPNISVLEESVFTKGMKFIKLDFNTVFLNKIELYKNIKKDITLKSKALLDILDKKSTKSLIYAGTYSNIDSISSILLAETECKNNQLLDNFSRWLGKNYDYNWKLTNLVKRGTGIHNGRLHRSLSQIQIQLFEENNGLNNIVSTSSIIEGVNTSAENVIIWMNKNGSSKLNDFTYKNIIGRGGRMFKYFIGNIYILDEPPKEEAIQLDIPFPEQIIGDLDEIEYEDILTKEQVAKIILYREEMNELIGVKVFEALKENSSFKSSNSELIKSIAIDMSLHPDSWNGLNYLNSSDPNNWDKFLYKIMNIQPGNWETRYSTYVSFIKIVSNNWDKSIPELLHCLEKYNVGVDDFFKLERNMTFKFASLLNDVNILQKEILKKDYDISTFISKVSHAFLPKIVFQLEEYGLPRMISKKIYRAGILDFFDDNLTIHKSIDIFNYIGLNDLKRIEDLDSFDLYILDYFYQGIKYDKVELA